jgi:hypothetical protein
MCAHDVRDCMEPLPTIDVLLAWFRANAAPTFVPVHYEQLTTAIVAASATTADELVAIANARYDMREGMQQWVELLHSGTADYRALGQLVLRTVIEENSVYVRFTPATLRYFLEPIRIMVHRTQPREFEHYTDIIISYLHAFVARLLSQIPGDAPPAYDLSMYTPESYTPVVRVLLDGLLDNVVRDNFFVALTTGALLRGYMRMRGYTTARDVLKKMPVSARLLLGNVLDDASVNEILRNEFLNHKPRAKRAWDNDEEDVDLVSAILNRAPAVLPGAELAASLLAEATATSKTINSAASRTLLSEYRARHGC